MSKSSCLFFFLQGIWLSRFIYIYLHYASFILRGGCLCVKADSPSLSAELMSCLSKSALAHSSIRKTGINFWCRTHVFWRTPKTMYEKPERPFPTTSHLPPMSSFKQMHFDSFHYIKSNGKVTDIYTQILLPIFCPSKCFYTTSHIHLHTPLSAAMSSIDTIHAAKMSISMPVWSNLLICYYLQFQFTHYLFVCVVFIYIFILYFLFFPN